MPDRKPPPWTGLGARAAILALFWWALVEGDAGSWWLGVPAVAVALWVGRNRDASLPLRWRALPSFLLLFLRRSVIGAVDVALRACAPTLAIAPAMVDYRTRLPAGLPRVCFVNSISLTPGTLGADLEGDTVRVHLLDDRGDHDRSLRTLEDALARVFGL
jgi:multicomponent Na+:H+ antiporter subunit E